MKPNIVPNCIRSESYMITFEVEEEKYIWTLDIKYILFLLVFIYLNWMFYIFPGSHYLERNTSWNLPVIYLLKPIAWFIFQVSSGLFLPWKRYFRSDYVTYVTHIIYWRFLYQHYYFNATFCTIRWTAIKILFCLQSDCWLARIDGCKLWLH